MEKTARWGGGYTGRGVLVPEKEYGAGWGRNTKEKYNEEIISVIHNPKRLL
jgi:hypothetical protein